MSAIGTILATAAVTVGAVAVTRHISKKWNEAKDMLRKVHEEHRSPYASADVIDFEKDPDTGTYHSPR